MLVNFKQAAFCREYMKDYNATAAYLRAGYGERGANTSASKLLAHACIRDRIAELEEEQVIRVGVTHDWVLRQWFLIAGADVSELMQIRVGCCRFCWGKDFNYQWSYSEYMRAVDFAMNSEKPKPAPDASGGFGYDRNKEPNSKCPECGGDGHEWMWIADTRKLTGAAKILYNGVQRTKDGLKILTRDKDAALANIAKYLGMIVDKKEVSGPGGGPIETANITARDLTDDQLAAIIARKHKTIEGGSLEIQSTD